MALLIFGIMIVNAILSFIATTSLIYFGWNYGVSSLHKRLTEISWLQAGFVKLGILGLKTYSFINLDVSQKS